MTGCVIEMLPVTEDTAGMIHSIQSSISNVICFVSRDILNMSDDAMDELSGKCQERVLLVLRFGGMKFRFLDRTLKCRFRFEVRRLELGALNDIV